MRRSSSRILLALLALALVHCGRQRGPDGDGDADADGDVDGDTDVDGDGDGDGDADADADADTDADADADADGDSVGSVCAGAHFATVDDFYAFLMQQRREYGGEDGFGRHERYKGIPWQGAYHEDTTFPNEFARDATLDARAQAEAERLAATSAPDGVEVPGASPGQRSFWVSGINTADWRISLAEEAGDFDAAGGFGGGDLPFALDSSNGSARLGFHYHDFGGDGPVITHMGMGAACDGTRTWWVLQMGP